MAEETISTALARAQQAMNHPKKTKTNPHFKSEYADLADVLNAVRPALNEQGIAVVQTVEDGDLVTELRWKDETISSRLPLNLNVKPQELGSQLSYFRRYALSAIAGVASEDDDDGNLAATSQTVAQARRYERPVAGEGAAATRAPTGATAPSHPEPLPSVVISQPEKPIAAMTVQELISFARENGVTVSGSKSDMIRTLQPLVLAATGQEPFGLDAPPVTPVDPETRPFEPVVAQ